MQLICRHKAKTSVQPAGITDDRQQQAEPAKDSDHGLQTSKTVGTRLLMIW